MNKVRFIPYTDDHAPQIILWRERADLAEFFRRMPPSMDISALDVLRSYFSKAYMICEENQEEGTSRIVGLAVIDNIEERSKTCEWGILIDPTLCSYRKEVSRQAHHMLLDYIFDYMELNKAYCRILAHRTGAEERLKLLGFQREALLREHFRGQDELIVACLRRDYKHYEKPFKKECA